MLGWQSRSRSGTLSDGGDANGSPAGERVRGHVRRRGALVAYRDIFRRGGVGVPRQAAAA